MIFFSYGVYDKRLIQRLIMQSEVFKLYSKEWCVHSLSLFSQKASRSKKESVTMFRASITRKWRHSQRLKLKCNLLKFVCYGIILHVSILRDNQKGLKSLFVFKAHLSAQDFLKYRLESLLKACPITGLKNLKNNQSAEKNPSFAILQIVYPF